MYKFFFSCLLLSYLLSSCHNNNDDYSSWEVYGGNGNNNHYSSLSQIDTNNVTQSTRDGHLRAFNKRTGKLLWEYKLPAAAFATPSTYEINGKQYL